jgi:SpoIID/LytB domain protein
VRRLAAVVAAVAVCASVAGSTTASAPLAGAEAPALHTRAAALHARAPAIHTRAAAIHTDPGYLERRDFSPGVTTQPPAGAAWFVRSLTNPRDRREARADILDAPTLPGSVMKAVTLVTALEAGVIAPETGAMCRRVVTVDGMRFVCAHPDLKRPLSPAEALAHSCNDFFVSLAPRLTREQVNRTRLAAGLPPVPTAAALGPSLVGLAGPRVTPRSLIDVLARLAGVGPDPAVPMRASTKKVLLDGLAGAAAYGTAGALGERGLTAWAKTGTAPMPGGGVAGVVVALVAAPGPTHGVVVVAPGAAGLDAASIAADLVATALRGETPSQATPAAPVSPAGVAAPPTAVDAIRVGRTAADGSVRPETIALDDYVAQVLAGEGQPKAADAAQQALAITARTFAVANRGRHRREGFDLCDTTHCQVARPATPVTRRAAAATSGQLLLQAGQPAPVFYSASCGGRLERASQVWPGAPDLSQPDRDDADASEPAWFSELRAADVERALRAAGLRGGRLRGLRVVQRNQSGRVVRLRVDGFSPPEISGNDFRMAVGRVMGWQHVKSTAFDVDRTGNGFRFRGRGFGHGVGLCVVGAGARAARGETTSAILRFYFPTLTVGGAAALQARAQPDSNAATRVTGERPVPATGGMAPPLAGALAPPATDVLIALPAAEEEARATLLALVRRARDEIAAATSQRAPSSIRVTVHPTVESFGRATGQQWWVSGATSGTSIALLPLAILQQQGQLERTVRHEVTHALLDAALAQRPIWVREGAAIYFARQPAGGSRQPAGGSRQPAGGSRQPDASRRDRVTCPTDAELLRAASAGAQRDAYARAEACFARQINAGKKWTEVR